MHKHIPNFLTCCNLFCGCLGIVFVLQNRDVPAAYFVWVAAVFDFFDGFAARALKVSSPIGKELDSLADVVSFGFLPGTVMFTMISGSTSNPWLPFVGFCITIFSALRLAIFNVDETQRDTFKGLNTPANTLFITSLPFVAPHVSYLNDPTVLILITVAFSLLMVSRLEFFAFKFKNFTWGDNKVRFIFLIASVVLLAIFKVLAIPVIILLYIAASFGLKVFSRS